MIERYGTDIANEVMPRTSTISGCELDATLILHDTDKEYNRIEQPNTESFLKAKDEYPKATNVSGFRSAWLEVDLQNPLTSSCKKRL